MRRVHRGELPLPARRELMRRQAQCTNSTTARAVWKSYRGSNDRLPVLNELKRMAGVRGRCFYCSDSLAADVEHYAPIATSHTVTFQWRNLLWVCPNCNRKKLARFPTDDVSGEPLLLNPAEDEPWAHLVLISETGLVAPRFTPDGRYDRRGEATLEVLDILTYEAANEGRVRVIRRLRAAAQRVVDSGGSTTTVGELIGEIQEDDYGVASWFVLHDGCIEEPFAALKNTMPTIWRRLIRLVVARQHGS